MPRRLSTPLTLPTLLLTLILLTQCLGQSSVKTLDKRPLDAVCGDGFCLAMFCDGDKLLLTGLTVEGKPLAANLGGLCRYGGYRLAASSSSPSLALVKTIENIVGLEILDVTDGVLRNAMVVWLEASKNPKVTYIGSRIFVASGHHVAVVSGERVEGKRFRVYVNGEWLPPLNTWVVSEGLYALELSVQGGFQLLFTRGTRPTLLLSVSDGYTNNLVDVRAVGDLLLVARSFPPLVYIVSGGVAHVVYFDALRGGEAFKPGYSVFGNHLILWVEPLNPKLFEKMFIEGGYRSEDMAPTLAIIDLSSRVYYTVRLEKLECRGFTLSLKGRGFIDRSLYRFTVEHDTLRFYTVSGLFNHVIVTVGLENLIEKLQPLGKNAPRKPGCIGHDIVMDVEASRLGYRGVCKLRMHVCVSGWDANLPPTGTIKILDERVEVSDGTATTYYRVYERAGIARVEVAEGFKVKVFREGVRHVIALNVPVTNIPVVVKNGRVVYEKLEEPLVEYTRLYDLKPIAHSIGIHDILDVEALPFGNIVVFVVFSPGRVGLIKARFSKGLLQTESITVEIPELNPSTLDFVKLYLDVGVSKELLTATLAEFSKGILVVYKGKAYMYQLRDWLVYCQNAVDDYILAVICPASQPRGECTTPVLVRIHVPSGVVEAWSLKALTERVARDKLSACRLEPLSRDKVVLWYKPFRLRQVPTRGTNTTIIDLGEGVVLESPDTHVIGDGAAMIYAGAWREVDLQSLGRGVKRVYMVLGYIVDEELKPLYHLAEYAIGLRLLDKHEAIVTEVQNNLLYTEGIAIAYLPPTPYMTVYSVQDHALNVHKRIGLTVLAMPPVVVRDSVFRSGRFNAIPLRAKPDRLQLYSYIAPVRHKQLVSKTAPNYLQWALVEAGVLLGPGAPPGLKLRTAKILLEELAEFAREAKPVEKARIQRTRVDVSIEELPVATYTATVKPFYVVDETLYVLRGRTRGYLLASPLAVTPLGKLKPEKKMVTIPDTEVNGVYMVYTLDKHLLPLTTGFEEEQHAILYPVCGGWRVYTGLGYAKVVEHPEHGFKVLAIEPGNGTTTLKILYVYRGGPVTGAKIAYVVDGVELGVVKTGLGGLAVINVRDVDGDGVIDVRLYGYAAYTHLRLPAPRVTLVKSLPGRGYTLLNLTKPLVDMLVVYNATVPVLTRYSSLARVTVYEGYPVEPPNNNMECTYLEFKVEPRWAIAFIGFSVETEKGAILYKLVGGVWKRVETRFSRGRLVAPHATPGVYAVCVPRLPPPPRPVKVEPSGVIEEPVTRLMVRFEKRLPSDVKAKLLVNGVEVKATIMVLSNTVLTVLAKPLGKGSYNVTLILESSGWRKPLHVTWRFTVSPKEVKTTTTRTTTTRTTTTPTTTQTTTTRTTPKTTATTTPKTTRTTATTATTPTTPKLTKTTPPRETTTPSTTTLTPPTTKPSTLSTTTVSVAQPKTKPGLPTLHVATAIAILVMVAAAAALLLRKR